MKPTQDVQAGNASTSTGLGGVVWVVMGDGPLTVELNRLAESVGARAERWPLGASMDSMGGRVALLVLDADHLPKGSLEQLASELPRLRCRVAVVCAQPTGACVTMAYSVGADALLARADGTHWQRALVQLAESPAPTSRPDDVRMPPAVAGSSTAMQDVWRLVLVAARSGSSVVVTGETGSGKEVVARALHRFSDRRDGPFVAVNCAALPETLLESELFGHERGAFTGAAGQRRGRFELAHGGTLFLDEIGDLPLGLQVKLLRVLQERTFERVGGTQPVNVDVRVVAATHHDLAEGVRKGTFRADLFYRLSVMSIRVPALRERGGDILELWDQLVPQECERLRRSIPRTSPDAQRTLVRHTWPGNVRELQNAVLHALAVQPGDTITTNDLPLSAQAAPVQEQGGLSGLAGHSMAEIERAAILQTCAATGSVGSAARMLGISPRKIFYRLKEYRREEQPAALPDMPVQPSGTPPVRVLLAEDDDELRKVLASLLAREGYDVVAVPSGQALLEHLGAALLLEQRDTPPDIIVTDIRMPGLNGLQLLEGARNRGWKIPVVVMSAFADDEVRERAHSLGAEAFLEKPLDMRTLCDVLHTALTRNSAQAAAAAAASNAPPQ